MTHKVITLEFVVPTVLAIALGTVLSIGAVYLTDKYLGPIDQAADGFGTAWQVRMLPAPLIDHANNIGRPSGTDLNADPGGGSAA